MTKHRVLKIKDVKSPLMHDYSKVDVYKIHGEKRGKVFMINNTFSGTKHQETKKREGTSVDVQNLTELFQQLHFEVELKTDLTAEEMVKWLEKERDSITDWDKIECVVLILMSHGKGEYIFGDDNKPVKLTDITAVFDSNHCKGLDEKPRLVFVQACRGVETPEEQLSKVCLKLEKQKLQSHTPGGQDQVDAVPSKDDKSSHVKHPAADFLVVYATPAGTLSSSSIDTGSWFLNAVVWTFKYHAKHEELHHLLLRVNRLVAKGKDPEEVGKKLTVSEVKSNLRKKLYFFPGVYGDSPQLFKD
ncbi:caspase-14-like [Mytilus trossulus]|uniref:caspase-14-like n=1 Tax=Mytilus trossulus TaxID=6551 RepID=UPI00300780EA